MTAALYAKIDALTATCEELRRELCIVRDAEVESAFRRRWKMGKSEAAILALLHRRVGRIATRSIMLDLLYADRMDPPEPKIIDVFVTRIRQKMGGKAFVVAEPKRGYRLAPAGVAACDEAITVASC